MTALITADLIVVVHFMYIVFVMLGALLAFRRPKIIWMHIPAVIWGAVIELSGGICPLTPLENRLRIAAGREGYAGDFIERYLIPLIYPDGLTRTVQLVLGAFVIVVNLILYTLLITRYRRRRNVV